MPTEIERLARAMDDMGGRLRGVVVSVVGEASQIGNSASDFSRHERGAGRQQRRDLHRHGQDRRERGAAGERHGEGRRPAGQPAANRREPTPQASARVAELGDRIQELAARHRADVAAAGQSLLGRPRSRPHLGRPGAGTRPPLGADHRVHRPDQADLVADQPARPERGHRGRPGRRARPRLRGRGRGGPPPRRLERGRRRGRGQDGAVHPRPGAAGGRHDGGGLGQGAGHRRRGGWRRPRALEEISAAVEEVHDGGREVAREVAANQAIVEQLGQTDSRGEPVGQRARLDRARKSPRRPKSRPRAPSRWPRRPATCCRAHTG